MSLNPPTDFCLGGIQAGWVVLSWDPSLKSLIREHLFPTCSEGLRKPVDTPVTVVAWLNNTAQKQISRVSKRM